MCTGGKLSYFLCLLDVGCVTFAVMYGMHPLYNRWGTTRW